MAEAPTYEQITEIQFDAFIFRTLDREVKNHVRDTQRQMRKQILFSEMDEWQPDEYEDACARNAFADIEAAFDVLEYSVAVHNDLLYDALTQLDEKYREVILMEFWLNMTDQEIADEINMKRRTVNNIRKKSYIKLREIMEANGHDARSLFPQP